MLFMWKPSSERMVGIPDKGRSRSRILRVARIPAGTAARGSKQRDGDYTFIWIRGPITQVASMTA
jgi:hypothetical protein